LWIIRASEGYRVDMIDLESVRGIASAVVFFILTLALSPLPDFSLDGFGNRSADEFHLSRRGNTALHIGRFLLGFFFRIDPFEFLIS
jgi:hypothetical protein